MAAPTAGVGYQWQQHDSEQKLHDGQVAARTQNGKHAIALSRFDGGAVNAAAVDKCRRDYAGLR